MGEAQDQRSDQLKQYFAQQVTHQTRQVLEVWLRHQRSEWSALALAELSEHCLRLKRLAERFEQRDHGRFANELIEIIEHVQARRDRLDSDSIERLSRAMQGLSRSGLRQGDRLEDTALPTAPRPVLIMLADLTAGELLARQLEFFGVSALALDSETAVLSCLAERQPAALVLDVDFSGPGLGLALAEALNDLPGERAPLLFVAHGQTDTRVHLESIRLGGHGMLTGTVEAWNLLEKLDSVLHSVPYDPFKVLIIDDSRAQGLLTERLLNGAGIITRSLVDPFDALAALAEFQPDLVILDLYMPMCTGPELARIIRHDERYVGVPIIYLSAEADLDKQLDAMSGGADDFLTKPIKPRHLITTVRNRAGRARQVRARLVRDSLTGLYNHTHILQLLDDSCQRSRRVGQSLCFAMLDLDHFKKVNDRFGHPMGDRVLKSLALFLRQRLRKTDHLGRYGGEEFAIVMPGTDLASAHKVLEAIRERFAEVRFPTAAGDLHCTFSAGLVQMAEGYDATVMAALADEALYRAKRLGRNRIQSVD